MAYAGGTDDITGGPDVNDEAWHHVVAVSENGVQTRMFIDGNKVATGGAPNLTGSSNPVRIGENPDATGRQWNGEIDDVGIFDTHLTDFQAQAIYTFGSPTLAYGYDLGKVVQLFDAHAAGAGGSVVIDGDTWNYAATDPGGSSEFILLAGGGSYTIPTSITGPGWMQARSYKGSTGEWSAMTTAYFTTAPAADASSVIINWGSAPADIAFVRSGTGTDGTPTLTYRATTPVSSGLKILLRLQVQTN